jgi:thiol-disulfide isomerase/thioredoxin
MKKYDIAKLKSQGKNAFEYINSLSSRNKPIFEKKIENYEPNKEQLQKLTSLMENKLLIVFSAEWCKDCKKYTSHLLKIIELQPQIEALFFGGLKTAPLDPNIKWKVPPSPEAVKEFPLEKIPTFYILDVSTGKIIDEIIESPNEKKTIEEELVDKLSN